MGAHILIIEDEEKLARFVELELLHWLITAKRTTEMEGKDFAWRRRKIMI